MVVVLDFGGGEAQDFMAASMEGGRGFIKGGWHRGLVPISPQAATSP